MQASRGERYVLIVRSASEEWLKDLKERCDIVVADIPHYSLKEQTELPNVIKATRAKLLFSPHFNVPYRCPVPFVVTIHDLILHQFPNNASLAKKIAYRILIRRAVTQASSVIAISSFVKGEIASRYGKSVLEKTMVIHQGVHERYVPAQQSDIDRIRSVYDITRDYFLYVGNAKQHKNVPALINGFVKAALPDTELILVTGGPEARALEPLPANVRFVTGVPDEDLPVLYSGANALLTASLYEGFCLPVAEALACGTPVIAADRTVIPEIAAGHALLIEPTAEAFARAMHSSLPRPKPFNVGGWKKTAEMTRTVLLEAMVR